MKITIDNQKENPHMGRKELTVIIEHPKEASPAKTALQAAVAQQTEAEVERVEIINILSDYGKPSSKSKIYLWNEKKVEDLSKPKEVAKEGETQEANKAQAKPPAAAKKK